MLYVVCLQIVSCSGDGMITFTDVNNCQTRDGYNYNTFDCHFGTVYQVGMFERYREWLFR